MLCLICREEHSDMSDEHIIPKALGGHIHCYRVCKTCNNRLGELVDNHLIDHWLSVAYRHRHRLKGNSRSIPNPLTGEGQLDDGTRVKILEDEDGKIAVKLIPGKPIVSDDGKSFSFTVDASEEKNIEKIKSKIISRLGISTDKFRIEENREHHELVQPLVKSQIQLDLLSYKIGLLKIAYEFACEHIPDYFESESAKEISKILKMGDIAKVKELNLVSDAVLPQSKKFLEEFIDYTRPDRHVLMLFNGEGGLLCFIQIGDIFNTVVRLSDTPFKISGEMVVAINDLKEPAPRYTTLEDLTLTAIEDSRLAYMFAEEIPDNIQRLLEECKVGIACNSENDNIFYDEAGNAIITTQSLLTQLSSMGNYSVSTEESGEMKTIYPIPEGLYWRLMPIDKLLPVKEIIEIQTIKKI